MGNDREEGWQPPPPTRGRELVGEERRKLRLEREKFSILIDRDAQQAVGATKNWSWKR